VVGPEKHVCDATECTVSLLPSKVISGSTKVVDFGTNRKRVFDFLLVINSSLTFVISCTVTDIGAYGGLKPRSKIANFYPPPPSFNAFARGDPLRILG